MIVSLQQITQSAHYLVLVDSHFDASGSPYRYLPQEDIEIVTNVQVSELWRERRIGGREGGREASQPGR